MNHEIVDSYAASFKVRYGDLERLFNGKLDAKKNRKQIVDTVNIFINFESLYNMLRRTDIEKYITGATKKEVRHIYRNAMSAFINVAAHYREFFNRHQIATNIFYYYNEIPDKYIDYNNSAFIPEYRYHFVDSLSSPDRLVINSLVADSIPFMEVISEYIDGVYMVGSSRVESSVIPYIIMMENKFPANMNIVITKENYDYLYCNKNCLVISKYHQDAVILTKYNIMDFLKHKFNYKGKKNFRAISPNLIPFIFAFLGDRKRSIPKIKQVGFATVYNALVDLYEVGYIFDEDVETMSFNHLCKVMSNYSSSVLNCSNYLDDLGNNYKAYDLDYQLQTASKNQIDDIMDKLKNKYDYEGLEALNNKYFEFYPLQIMELERYNPKRQSKLKDYLGETDT